MVQARAQAMQEASLQNPGGMVSIMGHEELNVKEICVAAMDYSSNKGTQKPVSCIANHLFPGGWVLGGDTSSVQYILEFGKAKVRMCNIIGAYHFVLKCNACRLCGIEGVVYDLTSHPPRKGLVWSLAVLSSA